MKSLSQDFEEYIRRNRAVPGDLWLFLHIPKTAGTSLGAQMAAKLTPSCNMWIDYNKKSPNYHANMLELVNKFLQADRVNPARFATGHLEMKHVDLIRSARPDMKLFTMLRNPIDRVISDYRYQLTEAHPQHRQFSERFKSIHQFALFEGSQNRMFKRLSTKRPISNQDLIEELESRFTFVGIQEMYPKSLAVLSRLVGFRLDPKFRERQTADLGANKVEITEDLKKQIAMVNRRDMALYLHFRRRLSEVQLEHYRAVSPAELAGQ